MTGVAAAISDGSQDVNVLVEEMLATLKHRGRDVRFFHANEHGQTLAIGCASSLNQKRLLEVEHAALALDGTFFAKAERRQMYTALQQSLKNFATLVMLPGAFAEIFTNRRKLFVIRDPIGLKPFYYARKTGLTAIASERKALWRIGFTEPERILPGHLYTITSERLIKKCLFKLQRPAERKMTLEYATSRLRMLLARSIRLITNGIDHVAVAFSGGLDSAVTALLAKQANVEVELISTGLAGSPELQTVENYARELDIPISIETYDADSLEYFVRRILWLTEEPNLMKTSIAIPLHWAALLAARRGHSIMLCGQGSDELYGGYYKYARILDTKGSRSLRSALYHSVLEASQVNYERDEQATCPAGVDLRTPFANLDVIQFSLQIPLQFKIKPGNDLVRKWVLRAVARKAGLAEDLVWRRKKAIQHGTGVENAIRRLAKKQGQSVEAYLSGVSQTDTHRETMP
jgi:asparagine synthase (glutamine-hydrolysing)